MYRLKQVEILAYNLIKERLQLAGYYPIKESTGLWQHKPRKSFFALCVDNFGVKHFNKDNVLHLMNTLQQDYDILIDWTRANYCGLNLE